MKTIAVLLMVASAAGAAAQNGPDPIGAEAYLKPPKPIAEILAAPRHRNVSFSNPNAGRSWFLSVDSGGPSTLAMIARPYVTLAGEQFDVEANRMRSMSTRSGVGFVLSSPSGERRAVPAPTGYRVSQPVWGPSGTRFAFLGHDDRGSYLFVADAASGTTRRIGTFALLPTVVQSLEWTRDESSIFAVIVPSIRPPAPSRGAAPGQPRVMVSEPTKNRVRPVRGLMETQSDQQLLEYLTTGQLARIELATGKAVPVGAPAIFRSISAAPDGSAIRIVKVQKPFSYIVGFDAFGSKEELWGPDGKVLAELASTPLRMGGGGAGPVGAGGRGTTGSTRPDERRDLKWRPDGDGLSYLMREPEAPRKEGDPPSTQRRKDRVLHWKPPYGKDDAVVVWEQDDPISSVQYSADCRILFLTQTRQGATEVAAIDLEAKKPVVLSTVRADDFYGNPGSLVSGPAPGGSAILVSPAKTAYFRGTEYARDPAKEAPRPFLDEVSLADGKRTRIWQSAPDVYETVEAVLDPAASQLLLVRQSPTMIPDTYRYDRPAKSLTKLTSNVDYAPQVTAAQRFRVRVTRPDGISFWVQVAMPSWWVKGSAKLPAMFWFYPSEYVDQKAYDDGERTYNKNAFPGTSNRSMTLLTLLGYAVVEPDCPIIGSADRKNDAYIPDLRNNLAATIDELERQGFIDRSRLALGGHSYGAFSTVNAMVHTPFFKAGIAGDGAYNRMLTPMAFQSETRSLWEARETYLTMSPLLYAEQLTGALLLYHGMDDLNPGTHPINSERLFNALDGLGKTVALYMYPYEDHGPIAIETIEDMWARWIPWLDKYVKNAGSK